MIRFPGKKTIERRDQKKLERQERQDIMAVLKRDFTITTDEAVATPAAGTVSLYRTEAGFRQKDDTGTASDVGGGGGDSAFQVATVPVSSVEMYDLYNTGKVIVAAQGPGTVILPIGVFVRLTFGTEPYNFEAAAAVLQVDLLFQYDLTALFNNVESKGAWITPAVPPGGSPISGAAEDRYVNKPLMLVNYGNDEVTEGDGTVEVTVFYHVLTLA